MGMVGEDEFNKRIASLICYIYRFAKSWVPEFI